MVVFYIPKHSFHVHGSLTSIFSDLYLEIVCWNVGKDIIRIKTPVYHDSKVLMLAIPAPITAPNIEKPL